MLLSSFKETRGVGHPFLVSASYFCCGTNQHELSSSIGERKRERGALLCRKSIVEERKVRGGRKGGGGRVAEAQMYSKDQRKYK